MATINLYDRYKAKLNKYGLLTSERFKAGFVEAVNSVYAELNDQVFRKQTLAYIESFDDVIDERLVAFTEIETTDPVDAANKASTWSFEFEFDAYRNADNAIIFHLYSDVSNEITIAYENGAILFQSVEAGVSQIICEGSVDLSAGKLSVISDNSGLTVYFNDEILDMTYTAGSSDTVIIIGQEEDLTSIKILETAPITLKSFSMTLGADGKLFDFPVNEGSGLALTDLINGYSATIAGEKWETFYVEPSSGLDSRYLSVFNVGLDYHLQDGNQWAIEPEGAVEVRWYNRSIPMARNINVQSSTYVPPLGNHSE